MLFRAIIWIFAKVKVTMGLNPGYLLIFFTSPKRVSQLKKTCRLEASEVSWPNLNHKLFITRIKYWNALQNIGILLHKQATLSNILVPSVYSFKFSQNFIRWHQNSDLRINFIKKIFRVWFQWPSSLEQRSMSMLKCAPSLRLNRFATYVKERLSPSTKNTVTDLWVI